MMVLRISEKYKYQTYVLYNMDPRLCNMQTIPGRIAQSVAGLETDASLTADPGNASLLRARSHTFVEIDHGIISTVILLPSAESFKKGCLSVTSESMCTKYWLTAC